VAKEKSEMIVNTAVAQPQVVAPASPMVTESFMRDVRLSTKQQLDAQEKFTVRLPQARKSEVNYVVVGVNGHNYQIQRGVSVEVPETVYNLLVEANII
jgi:hypothetical protein